MILFAFLVSVFDLGYQSVMPGALAVAGICGIVGFCFPGIGGRIVRAHLVKVIKLTVYFQEIYQGEFCAC